ncbi:MAG: hypothetical protein N3E36_02070 [Sulfolobales archaeon]|nr:hypothetical protein [Sulfolobales archaeon]MCX8198801.1 hypothetical protein [Sulfolobales archaeon]MDW8169874.1 hypothetical protein [Desulfurococcaceae archaeon]
MKIAVIYYSKTGKTKRLVEYISHKLKDLGVKVDVFTVKPFREYSSKLLHLNPRILYETLLSRNISIKGDEGFEPERYDAVIIATPIWWGMEAPPIHSFIQKYASLIKTPTYCIVTADLPIDYASKLLKILKTQGYRVKECIQVTELEKDRGRIDAMLDRIPRT